MRHSDGGSSQHCSQNITNSLSRHANCHCSDVSDDARWRLPPALAAAHASRNVFAQWPLRGGLSCWDHAGLRMCLAGTAIDRCGDLDAARFWACVARRTLSDGTVAEHRDPRRMTLSRPRKHDQPAAACERPRVDAFTAAPVPRELRVAASTSPRANSSSNASFHPATTNRRSPRASA